MYLRARTAAEKPVSPKFMLTRGVIIINLILGFIVVEYVGRAALIHEIFISQSRSKAKAGNRETAPTGKSEIPLKFFI